VIERAADRRAVLVGRRCHGERADRERLGLRRRRERVEDIGIIRASLVGVPGRGRRCTECLEPPDSVGQPQHPVVERDPRVRLRDRPVRRRRQHLDQVSELVAPRPDPATPEHPALRDRRQVDVVERVPVKDPHGVEGDQGLAVVPVADQRDDAVAAAEAAQYLDRFEPDVEADPTNVSRQICRQ
jgi:hypothetical protein